MGSTGGTKDGTAGLQTTAAVPRESPQQWLGLCTHTQTHTKWLAHNVAINTATVSLIFNCVDGLHLCCSVMQTLLYILSGLIVIRAENLIKLNNKGDHSRIFFPEQTSLPPRCVLTPSVLQRCSCPEESAWLNGFITQ